MALAWVWIAQNGDVTWAPWRLKSPATPLYVQQTLQVNKRDNIKMLYQLPFLWWDWRRENSPYKGTVMLNAFPCRGVIVKCLQSCLCAPCLSKFWPRYFLCYMKYRDVYPDREAHWAKMGPTWVLSAPAGPHVGPMNLAIRIRLCYIWEN